MALLQGTGGTTGRRSRVDRPRAPESEPGSLRSLPESGAVDLEIENADRSDRTNLREGDGRGTDDEQAGRPGGLQVDRGLSISRDGRDGDGARGAGSGGLNVAALEAALLRLAAAGPTLGDVLEVLVHEAAVLLQAPARIALALDDRLIWTTSSGDSDFTVGAEVDVVGTACGEAWRTGLIQNVSRPTGTVISLDQPQSAVDGGVQLTTDCCGSPAVLLAVPLLREGPTVPGRHAGFTREVFAVLALIGERPNWFDDDDIEATADLAEVAGERIAALVLIGPPPESVPLAPGRGWVPVQGGGPGFLPAPDLTGRVQALVEPSKVQRQVQRQVEPSQDEQSQTARSHGQRSHVELGPVELGPVELGSAEQSQAERSDVELGPVEPGQADLGAAEPDSAPARPLPVRVPTAKFDWPPLLVPSAGEMPATTTSITIVPARPGRSGFGGWFARGPKARPAPVIPGPRVEPDVATATTFAPIMPTRSENERLSALKPLPRRPVRNDPSRGEPVGVEPVQSRMVQGGTGEGGAVQSGPVRAEAVRGEIAQGETLRDETARDEAVRGEAVQNRTILSETAQRETMLDDSIQDEPVQNDRVQNQTVPNQTVPNPTAQPEAVPVRIGSSREIPLNKTASGEIEPGFGPKSRLPRVRTRVIGGTPMPPAMPAADSMGLWQWDALSGECTWSSPVARLLGLAPEAELTLALVREAVAPADRGRFDIAVRAIGTGRGVAGALRLKTSDGRAKHAYAWSEVRRDDSGKLLGAWGGVVDVTAFEHDAAALRSGLAGLRAAQELTGLATWEWRADAGQLIWSDEMYRLAGVPAETFEPTPERWHAFVHPDDLERARRLDLGADLDAGPGAASERVETFRLIGPGGEIRHVQSWSATSADRVVYGATIDVTRQVHDRMTLERLSATDPVTGLGNRLAFDRRMQQLLGGAEAARAGRPAGSSPSVTLILLDLDRFKVVNDSLGHQVGDRLLIEVARRLVAVVPNGSVTVRMGGDEFVVVPPPGAAELEVRRLASGIVEALRAPYVLPETGELLICPASLGIAMSENRRVTGHDLLREADIALYRAKDSGRDRYVIFDEALKARTLTRQRAERRLRSALEEDRLVMQYQPVIDFSNGRVIGAEGLVRLHDSEGPPESQDRLIAPELFLDIAEQTGLVVEIDCWVIETAIQQLAAWAGPDEAGPWLAINLSARSMEHPRVIRRLIEAVKRGEVDRDRIKIELTEKSFIGSLPGVDAGVRQLIANGVGVGIDDFGTGYSALAYLPHFDLDFMKIDRSFVASVGEGPRGDAVVTAIVDLAHAHGMRVIAEGVESGRQARRLREIGCDFAQGFHFGRPGEAHRIVRG